MRWFDARPNAIRTFGLRIKQFFNGFQHFIFQTFWKHLHILFYHLGVSDHRRLCMIWRKVTILSNYSWKFETSTLVTSAALSIRLTRLKPRAPPRAGPHQEQGSTKIMGQCNLFSGSGMLRKEGNVLFNDALNTLYLRLYGVRHMVKDHPVVREETRCRHMGYSFRLAARVLLYAYIPQTG